jgi:hypothetical protein
MSAGAHDSLNAQRSLLRIFVFPDPDADPAGLSQSLVGVAVARNVARYFVRPKLGVRYSDGVMLRAPVPKASIEEDRDLRLRECEVSRAPQVL